MDTRALIDVQVVRNSPQHVKAKGRCFIENDRQKIRVLMRRVVENSILPFNQKRIRDLEDQVAKTKKGFKNMLSNFISKKSDRGDSDGLRENFRMNKTESELRNLCDLALVIQDYDTAASNASYPYKDFLETKAFRFAASCLEIQFISQVVVDLAQMKPLNF